MDRWLDKHSERLYATMRLVAGLLFACHGAQKLFGVLGGQSQLGNPRLLTAGVIEFGGGLLIAAGLWAGYAAFVASGQMAVAYFTVHTRGGFWPIVNRGELAVLYCFVFLYIASRGSGVWSIEGLVGREKRRKGGGAGPSV
jgi:putative oxidoreductase